MKSKLKKFGEKMADAVTDYCGSWSFIFWFLGISALYMAYNSISKHAFDPIWFPGLNLLLGFVSSLTAPFLIMSGNRQSLKDRKKAAEDLYTDRETNEIVKQILKEIKEGKDVE